jgi:hypothetical protein
LREHDVFRGPLPFPGKPQPMPVPGAWLDELGGKETVDLVPLVDGDGGGGAGPGWCTYDWGFDAPDVEVFCGGQNSKTATAAAVWRQGWLVHFGFEQSPAQLNDAGDALLVNVIAYAARCAADRPITRVESPFRTKKRAVMPREKARRHVEDGKAVGTWFTGAAEEELLAVPAGARAARLRELEPFLVADAGSELDVDATLRGWGTANRDVAMLDRCVQALRAGGDDAARARAVLARYVPDGPGATGAAADDAEAWARWVEAHRSFVFFSDVGGYRWYVDALALARGTPSQDLRGTQRVAKAPR